MGSALPEPAGDLTSTTAGGAGFASNGRNIAGVRKSSHFTMDKEFSRKVVAPPALRVIDTTSRECDIVPKREKSAYLIEFTSF